MEADLTKPVQPEELGHILLHIATSLLHAGAGSARVVKNVSRIADAFGFRAHIDVATRSVSISLDDKNLQEHVYTGSHSTPSLPGADFKVIAAISRLSWAAVEKKMSLEELKSEYVQAVKSSTYPRIAILGLVGLSGTAFCYTFGGTWSEMVITFVATVSGLLIRQQMQRLSYNPYLTTFCAAACATLVVCLASLLQLGSRLDHAFATSILFLIPGVPLIMAFLDLMNGYILNGLDRGVHASIHAFAIATGLATMLYLFNIQ